MRERKDDKRLEGGREMNTKEYLSRIGIEADDLEADAESLRLLERYHLLHVPFENLDIHWKRPIVVDTEKFYEKIVNEKRGGFCYELNGLFNELLKDIGFKTRLLSARVFNGTIHGPEFDHATIIVTIGDDEYLADVGFGDFAAEALRFSIGVEQQDECGDFVIRKFDEEYLEVAKKDGDAWKREFIFKDVPHDLSEFAGMCDFQQYSPESHFRKGKVCSIKTENGRKTLTDKEFIVTKNGVKTETDITGNEEFNGALKAEF